MKGQFHSESIQEFTPTFRRRSPTILRAEILADGVRGELPQPLVNAFEREEKKKKKKKGKWM